MMAFPVKITRDLRLLVEPDAPPLTGAQALDLGRRLLERGAVQVAREAVWPPSARSNAEESRRQ
jgi:hypothetical protein